jgi:hypothetical protein
MRAEILPHLFISTWRHLGLALLGLLALSGLAGAGAPWPPPSFAAHPRLAYSSAELESWRTTPARHAEYQRALARGETILARGLQVPAGAGDWFFYYACPKDGGYLTALTEARHECPTCKAIYTDPRTVAAYRGIQHAQLEEDCLALGVAYALSGDARFAHLVGEALLELARRYPDYPRHDRWGRKGLLAVVGGWRYAQLLDEATGIIKLAKAYDLIASAPTLSVPERTTIEERLLKHVAQAIHRNQLFVGLRNNHQTWFNAAYAAVGVATGDETLLREAIDGKAGLRWQLTASVTEDGLWYEGTLAYQRYAMLAIVETLQAVRRVGWDLAGEPRLKGLWLGPVQLAYPNGQLPVFHDSDPADLKGWESLLRWGADYFGDSALASSSALTAAPALRSVNLAGIGLAVLRYGQGAGAQCAMLDYGLHGDHHGHPDKLNLVLFARGRELLPDPGRLTYSVPEYETWARTTLAHNTVVLNGRNQRPDTGRLLYFQADEHWSGVLAASDGAYPGVALKRFVVLLDGLLLEAFTVESEREVQADWVAHPNGLLEPALPLQPTMAPLTGEGYAHLTGLQDGGGTPLGLFTVRLPGGESFRLWAVGDEHAHLFTGLGIGYRLTERIPLLLRRRTGRALLFLTIYDLTGRASLQRVERLPVMAGKTVLPPPSAVGVRLQTDQGALLVGLDLRDKPSPMSVDGHSFTRCLVQDARRSAGLDRVEMRAVGADSKGR